MHSLKTVTPVYPALTAYSTSCNSPLFCIHAAAAYSTSLYIKNGHKAHFKNSKKLPAV